MLIVQDKLISLDIVEQHFICDLNACKGACCVQGDSGAPLEEGEVRTLENLLEKILPYLTLEGRAALEQHGVYTVEEDGTLATTLIGKEGACAFVTFDERGTALCGIEKAFRDGSIDFQKPISCHLYPIRIKAKPSENFEALNYDRWHICSPACQLGEREQMPVYQFLKEPLIRKYGDGFYDELHEAALYLQNKR